MASDAKPRRAARQRALRAFEATLEVPMIFLSLAWVALVIYQLVAVKNATVDLVSTVLWGVFIVDVLLRLAIAPDKTQFLARNWLLVIALIFPGVRSLAVFRLVRIAHVTPVFRVAIAVHRGARALARTLGHSGGVYVLSLTVFMAFAGAAAMYAAEGDGPKGLAFSNYWDALWWTAMTLTTMGAGYTPHTAVGRTVCLILAVYAFSTFGYVTAVFARFLVQAKPGPDTVAAQMAALRQDIRALSIAVAATHGLERRDTDPPGRSTELRADLEPHAGHPGG